MFWIFDAVLFSHVSIRLFSSVVLIFLPIHSLDRLQPVVEQGAAM